MQNFIYVYDIDHGILFCFPTVLRRHKSNYLLFLRQKSIHLAKVQHICFIIDLRHSPMDYLGTRFNIYFNSISAVNFY